MLDVLRSYRGDEDSTEPLPFGIYGEVLEGGVVRLGDSVSLDGG
jgi:MOSC domain-containing protein YiiM